MDKAKIAILGAGSWGTAVAIHLANCGNQVLLWAHNPQHVQDMMQARCNARYLPGIYFPNNLIPTAKLANCVGEDIETIIAVPSHAFSSLLLQLKKPPHGLSWLTKGIDPETHKLPSQLVAEHWGDSFPLAIISGPSFAKEVANFLPTALTLAGNDLTYQKRMQKLLHCKNVRVYLSSDVLGVQLCGAVKNVLAIACGISDGLGYGANAKAAIITRGLAEMRRLGIQMGAREETFMGLAGLGDLVLTCTDDKSRNRRFGLHLGHGMGIDEAEKQIGQVVEGKYNASQVCLLAAQFNVEMPICMQINAVLSGKMNVNEVAQALMSRSPKEE
ncbi:NAD(P)H-dependent glycerol-3-phosphate dehydrogenase [Legionella jordanis]|uniref:Glycerol-3-phosphate dehydrogenase [NAD(P)+] n=1 Tax=Legionella jordanis TaxID=456 RepID=A0A0W0V9D7_9GAMM|nr:NAD(P)H-dependent glycerol-3-phosphate dehydrogenase [Legionella jordanis]KTD16706.1 glycerol-3-phosphate dehydrogenase (NAD(P)+) [Legionella jordanis]RMX03764.1 glycerol-3-phosphate dehydrogenase [Legionella jordanis]RMX22174.1 glycerol-3-phosphate dehydrogenase [Legionella jordanis]VEH11826.1 glycerol-3-phosphate dehydrogenase (NAD(P)+) [Legionella jordanis]